MPRRLIGDHPHLAFGTIAAAAFVLSTCSRDEAIVFTSANQCLASGMDAEVCKAAAEDARLAHLAAAPRYRNMVACEMEYGSRNCVEQPGNTVPDNPSGQSVFLPMLAGFVLSSGVKDLDDYYRYRRREEEGGSSGGSVRIYRKRSGEMVTPVADKRGGTRSINAPDTMRMQHFNPKTHAASRNGFGSRLFSGG
ncbi:hypothetical protein ACO34A_22880 (plasmid) [Rhizobium sp. ACO-34A]|nr:DUF1190 domain-containing protein [Rhizobium sp. ACO-34A]ATN36636.1 hypothetical protein ACO34A_22880 [Rhizobium sp. ACO-34A]